MEGAVRTASQGALGVIGADTLGILDVDWGATCSVAGLAAVVSLLMSVAAGGTGDPSTAGFATRSDR
nr:MAG: Holin [Chloroflexota bacterium]